MIISTRNILACCIGGFVFSALTGCRTVDETQFQIRDGEMSAANRERVVELVQDVAVNAGMVDVTARSKAANTLIYFEEPVKTFRTTLGVRSVGDSFVIDLGCFDARHCESTTFSVIQALLEKSLQREFGDHWQLVNSAERVPVL